MADTKCELCKVHDGCCQVGRSDENENTKHRWQLRFSEIQPELTNVPISPNFLPNLSN